MLEKVLVLGYYDRNNFGDDVFANVFRNVVFKDSNMDIQLTICNIEELTDITNEKYDKIIIGGGDLINRYFLTDDRMSILRNQFGDTPILFFGVGIPFVDLLGLMDIGDYFFMRNRNDYEIVKYRYGPLCTSYTPDLAFYLNPPQSSASRTRSNKIGVVIPYTWISSKMYSDFIHGLLNVVTSLIRNGHVIYFIPFDTSDSPYNSDKFAIQEISQRLKGMEFDPQTGKQQIFYTNTTGMNFDQMCALFLELDLCLASRFHSVIMSIMTETPFLSMYTQRKIETLKNDVSPLLKDLFVALPVDDRGIPTSIDADCVLNKIEDILANYDKVKSNINICYAVKLKREADDALQKFRRAFQTARKRASPPQTISDVEKTALVQKTVKAVLSTIDKLSIRNVNKVWDNVPLKALLTKRNTVIHNSIVENVAAEILWHTTGDPHGPYYYGLTQNLIDNGLIDQINWIIDDYYLKYKYQDTSATVVNKNFQEVHRSGWQYIVNNLTMHSGDKPLIIDTYVDKTFHWNCKFYSDHGVIPYTRDWIGFIHHTYSAYNNPYNCKTLFKNRLFLESLRNCKCLIVMSEYLAQQVKVSLLSLNLNVPVRVVTHPSEKADIIFRWDDFLLSHDRPIVQVGTWLRNVFSIFPLEVPKDSIVTRKAVLKNKNSDNYFLPPEFLEDFLEFSRPYRADNDALDICRMSYSNMHVKGLCQHIIDVENSVEVLEHLGNEEYDKLLSHSIVFIHLVDASAVNTIIECILRATPILVNPIPSVIELLGQDYPLYYSTMFEASALLANEAKLKSGWEYLSQMDKSKFKISTFLSDLQGIITDLC